MTDCARISLEFTTGEALEKAAKFMLTGKTNSFKNRMATPTAEGYRDLLFKVLIGGHVCEVPPPPAPRPHPIGPPRPCCLRHRSFLVGEVRREDARGGRWACFARGVGAGGLRVRPAPFSRGESARRPQVQLHLVAMIKAKRHAPAHTVYKLCQRVLKTPMVAKSTYCLEVTAKGELTGEGERNAEGKPEGRGTMVYASGNMYEGQWLAGRQAGEGRCTFATGNVYEGSYKEDKKHGKGKETFPDGMVQVNCYDQNQKVGLGVFWSADGRKAWELQNGKRSRSVPLNEATEIAERVVAGQERTGGSDEEIQAAAAAAEAKPARGGVMGSIGSMAKKGGGAVMGGMTSLAEGTIDAAFDPLGTIKGGIEGGIEGTKNAAHMAKDLGTSAVEGAAAGVKTQMELELYALKSVGQGIGIAGDDDD